MTEVLSLPVQSDGSSYFSSSPLQRSSPTQSFLINSPSPYSRSSSKSPQFYTPYADQLPPSPASTPTLTSEDEDAPSRSSLRSSTPPIYSTFDAKADDEDQILFPSYDDYSRRREEDLEPPSSIPSRRYDPSSGSNSVVSTTTANANASGLGSPDFLKKPAEDDTAIQHEPAEHVDYLSHNWKEDELWASWKHVVSRRKSYSNSERLENASWRTWTMSRDRLKTVCPETLNWQKESDVTWLYGPLQTRSHMSSVMPFSAPSGDRLSKSNSFLNKKPILKKRSVSEMMLQRSLSASSLLKQATASIQAQATDGSRSYGGRPSLSRAASDFCTSTLASTAGSGVGTSTGPSATSSGLQTPGTGEKRHIHFNDRVEQCIAVDGKDGDEDEEEIEEEAIDEVDEVDYSEDDSDDGLIMMKGSAKARTSNRSTPRASFSSDSKTIAMLPSTTLNYREEISLARQRQQQQQKLIPGGGFWATNKVSPSPSQETLRPSNAHENFLLVEDDEDADMAWEPPRTSSDRRSYPVRGDVSQDSWDEENDEQHSGLRRTPSGMFMPYEEDEDDIVAAGLFGKVVNAVNTAKDIGHVIWNVGWKA
ncbi:MAG: hypothetical protein M1837_003063 [Sclerophora amabilis]|nr:MAG: hypothetical protein M1837_003063 [Sclerophora amabilis]